VPTETVAYKIAVAAVPSLADKTLVPVYMPMVLDREEVERQHKVAADTVEAYLKQDKNVVFLTLGDPTVYSTYMYVQHLIEARGYTTRLVSGITSFCAAAARANVSLVEWNEQLHVLPAVHRLGHELDEPGNYVLMKSGRQMGQVKEMLRKSGRDVVMLENCGMETEHIYHSVDEIPDNAGYYSLIIAKEAKA
jgi:precorrin-2/cobalt-factor-2 C20-methyltransferase